MERRLRCMPNGAVLKIMKQCGVIERHSLAIGKFEPGIYTIVRSFSPDDSLRLPFLAAVRTVSRQSSIPLFCACICLDARHKY
jgi:hypothetical protein